MTEGFRDSLANFLSEMLGRLRTRLIGSPGDLAAQLNLAYERLELTQTATGLTSWEWDLATDTMTWTAGVPNLHVLGKQPTLKFSDVIAGVHPDDRLATRIAADQAVLLNTIYNKEFRVVLPNGGLRWIHSRGKVFNDPHGKPQRMLGVNMDITERKRFEMEVRKEKDRFRSIFEQTAVGIAYLDPSGKFRLPNLTFCSMLGYAPDELTTMEVLAIVHPLDRAISAARVEEFNKFNEREYTAERRFLRKDGSSFIAEVNVSRIAAHEENPASVVLIIKDISQRVAAEAAARRAAYEMQEALSAAAAANAAKSQFLANMSHEIRTPLAAIIGFSELLQDGQLSAEKRQEFTQIIARNGTALNQLIGAILDVSKIEADSLETIFSEISLPALLYDVRDTLLPQAASNALVLEVVCDDQLPTVISTDAGKLRQILLNIVGNAVKFTKSGTVQMSATVAAAPATTGANIMLKFRVRDTGIGMTTEQQAKLFKLFSQADASATRSYGGVGLGLFLARRLAQLLGGELLLESSEPGKGSVFVAMVPVLLNAPETRSVAAAAASAAANGAAPTAANESTPCLRGVRVLIVEDTEATQVFLCYCLRQAGAEVVLATDGKDAIEKAANEQFQVILMDMQLPHIDGITATKAIRARGYKGKIIALTAHALTDDRELCLAAGCDSHVTKPITPADLLKIVAVSHR